MSRAVMVYASLLLVALVGSYWVWTHEQGPDLSKSVVLLPGDADDLQSVAYTSADVEVTLEMLKDDLGRYAWVRVVPLDTEEEEEEPANPHAPKDDGEPAEFKAGKGATPLLDGVAPFLASRELTDVTEEQVAELGLEPPEGTLTITRSGRDPKSFDVGKSVYGGKNIYVRDPDNGKVFVVSSQVIKPLKAAKRALPDRLLVDVETKDIKTMSVSAAEATADFEQHNPDDRDALYWSVVGSDEKSEEGQAWVDKALRLRGSKYLSSDEEPGGLEEAFTFAVTAADKHVTTVSVLRALGDEGEDEWYARSEHTRSLVKLNRALAAETFADLESALEAGAE